MVIVYYCLRFHDHTLYACKFTSFIIIVVIITWPSEKLHQKKNSDITVIWVCDWFKWVMFMQNFEYDVTVFNQ